MAAAALTADGLLAAEAVRAFTDDGFLAIDRLVDAAEVDRLRAAYDEILDDDEGVPTDRLLGGITRQVMVPSMHHPVMADNGAIAAAKRVVGQLFGTPTAARTYDMLIDKPPGHPHVTPWHQDAGYFGRPVTTPGTPIRFHSVQVWLALDEVDVDNGCMQFVPGRHHDPVLEHRVASGDPTEEGRLIELVDPGAQLDLSTAMPQPLRPGGCTMHLAGTPHFTGANLTADRRRRAYIFNLDPADSDRSPIEDVIRANFVDEIDSRRRD